MKIESVERLRGKLQEFSAQEYGYIVLGTEDVSKLLTLIDLLVSEGQESARLHGMGAEREARLLGRVEELTKEQGKLQAALQWYVDNDDTYEGGKWEESNHTWLAGKRNARRLLGLEDA